jgi:hypothetical protein
MQRALLSLFHQKYSSRLQLCGAPLLLKKLISNQARKQLTIAFAVLAVFITEFNHTHSEILDTDDAAQDQAAPVYQAVFARVMGQFESEMVRHMICPRPRTTQALLFLYSVPAVAETPAFQSFDRLVSHWLCVCADCVAVFYDALVTE